MKELIARIAGAVISPSGKWQIKFSLSIVAFVIVIAMMMFTNSVVHELMMREQKNIKLYADIYKKYTDPNSNIEDFLVLIDQITPTITFPVIMTDVNDQPIEDYKSYTLNVEFDSTKTLLQQKQYLIKYIAKMKESYPPILITDGEGKVLQKFYYTNSALIDKLRFFPLIAFAIVSAFIFVGYIAFSNVRRGEQSRVWVGMAREAAHQLGTPLSSLLAWIEILKYSKDEPQHIDDTIHEMQNDINRLQVITTRFSKIGSLPEMENLDMKELIEEVALYFEKRLPHLGGRKVELIRNIEGPLWASVNKDLFAWVFENLIKNAAEAIEEKQGTIEITAMNLHDKKIVITVRDSGKGIPVKKRKQVFYPGYTTKKRGWGLGLSLTKRIVEEYHSGKIYVKDSAPGKGTTFWIEIPVKETLKAVAEK